jgi:hypothetical protein
VGDVVALEQAGAGAGDDREDPEVVLVDQLVLQQGPVERAGAERQDVLVGVRVAGPLRPGLGEALVGGTAEQ